MPFVDLDDQVQLHVRTDGDARRPCLVLSNSLGTDLSMWDAQAAALAADFFVLRYDTRGHGRSRGIGQPFGIERLGRDVLGLLDHFGIERATFCGISMGGLTGQWLGVHAPARLTGLVLANTAARIGTAAAWRTRAAHVRADGMDAIADGAPARWFSEAFIRQAPATVARMADTLRAQDAAGYAACCEALADADLREDVHAIASPTLIIAGEHDPVTTVQDAAWLCERIPGAHMAGVRASHISNVEAEADFTALLREFLRA